MEEILFVFIPSFLSFLSRSQALLYSSCKLTRLLLKLKENTSRDVRCVAPNDVCVENELHPFFYTTTWLVWHRKIRKPPWTTSAWRHATAIGDWACPRYLGCGRTQGAATPWLAHLAIAFARWASGQAWAPPTVVLGLGCCVKVGFSISSHCAFLFYAFCLRLFAWFSTCIQMLFLQNIFLPIQVELCQQ